jgi:hypothetical protein
MNKRTKLLRLLGGMALIVAILGVIFPLIPGWIHAWGANSTEVAASYPGDEILTDPLILWTHATTIQASPEEVWPWIAQIGDRRGGFYSYTFIENMIAGEKLYHNASQIVPEWQAPQPGEEIIGGMMQVKEVETGTWFLAESPGDIGWTWLWTIAPAEANTTRMIIRMRIQLPDEMSNNPLVSWIMDGGGFVMERRMIQGIRDRAEGRSDPPFSETMEIALWITALLGGIGGGIIFLWRPPWTWALGVGISAVFLLLIFTFVQPPLWLRLILDLALWAGLWKAWRVARQSM